MQGKGTLIIINMLNALGKRFFCSIIMLFRKKREMKRSVVTWIVSFTCIPADTMRFRLMLRIVSSLKISDNIMLPASSIKMLGLPSRNLPHEKRPQQKDRGDDLKPTDPHVKY